MNSFLGFSNSSYVREEKQNYSELDYWWQYQGVIPPEWRLRPDNNLTEEWWDYQNHHIHIDRMIPSKPKNLKVILVHGGGGNGRLLNPYAVMLYKMGNEVLAPDFPGYGVTVWDKKQKLTFDLWIDVLDALIDRELEKESTPVVLFGFSVGGPIAYFATAKNQKPVGIMATMLADPRLDEVQEAFASSKSLARIGSWWMANFPGMTDGIWMSLPKLTNLQEMSNNQRIVRLFEEDPLVGKGAMPLVFARTMKQYKPELEPNEFDLCPILLVHPEADKWTPVKLSDDFLNRVKGPSEKVLLTNSSHFPVENPGNEELKNAVSNFLDRISFNLKQ